MKSFYLKDGVQIVFAILITGTMAYAMQPTASESVQDAPKVEIVQTTESKPKSATEPQEKAQEKPKTSAKKVTWRDNPNKCNEDTQYIAAEKPYKCIDKPTTSQSVAPATTKSAPASADDGSAKMFIYMRESGNNPGAINASSGACGLGQALPCSKMPCSLSDYACQDRFFTGYMQARYGTWENAKAFWLANHWW